MSGEGKAGPPGLGSRSGFPPGKNRGRFPTPPGGPGGDRFPGPGGPPPHFPGMSLYIRVRAEISFLPPGCDSCSRTVVKGDLLCTNHFYKVFEHSCVKTTSL